LDFTGTLLGMLTIPMALFNAGAGIAGFWLVLRGEGVSVGIGIVLFGVGALFGPMVPGAGSGLAEIALAEKNAGRRHWASALAALNSAFPLVVILVWEVAVFLFFKERGADGETVAHWFWSYGIATGIWSWRAHRAAPEDRTLSSIQAYSAQISYVILSACVMLSGWPMPAAIAVMLPPMALPLITGYLLALADRAALRDVQI
jgi:hypothetical protein